jgi:hypothetical protein
MKSASTRTRPAPSSEAAAARTKCENEKSVIGVIGQI